ncbi:hypothetical protein GCM10022198_22090 [Klugiella xanthotipulae]|uniref:TetR family transcriptional regulator n=1 Tax=Klugiella xanthotipulae TaxID=244735 RepID=A0A543HYA2_9MICO|nr:TetR/AcrR family transcriptional regulator [Klugiella xanthotipulae]TQM63293.1 TetR family transcriptional regulator [Klugiella xanthotipulae]
MTADTPSPSRPGPSAGAAMGLRERKQRALRERVETIAVNLVDERGYDGVSVDLICERAEISQRTFFNYFGTKEKAVLGNEPPEVTEEHLARIVADDRADTLAVLFDFLATLDTLTEHERSMRVRRREVIMRHPELMRMIFARVDALQEVLSAAVLQRMLRLRGLTEATPEMREEARMTINMSACILKFTSEQWAREQIAEGILPGLQRARDLAARVLGAR